MARGHPGMPRPQELVLSKQLLLDQLYRIDRETSRRDKVLRLETAFREKVRSHIASLPARDSTLQKFNTSPYVLLIHASQRGYTRVSELEADILPAKQFSSMETSAGRMVEEVVLPEYGWECVASTMHSSKSAIDGQRVDGDVLRLVTLKSGPRCLNDEMSENFADAILANYRAWAEGANTRSIDFSYGVLYGTKKQSNKKDWHILRNIKEKAGSTLTVSPENQWHCQVKESGVVLDVSIRIGLDWWQHLGGELCFVEVFTALIRACINPGASDPGSYPYVIGDLGSIVSADFVAEGFNVSLLQYSQLPWLFLMARHFCDHLHDE